jgi:triosephosphate isomerase
LPGYFTAAVRNVMRISFYLFDRFYLIFLTLSRVVFCATKIQFCPNWRDGCVNFNGDFFVARRFFIAGNWKMNLTLASSLELAGGLKKQLSGNANVEVAVCPPSIYLQQVAVLLKDSGIGVGAQNVYHQAKGAFTGEISTAMLLDIGVKYVILGHSERRHILHESNADVNAKTLAALASGLTPIVCVGELLSDREAGTTESVVRDQFEGSFDNVSADDMKKSIIAYEPVWAIGTGKVATPDQAEEVHQVIRNLIEKKYGKDIAESVRIQYGGSVNDENAKEILAKPNVDGALVGGASLKVESFVNIVKSV